MKLFLTCALTLLATASAPAAVTVVNNEEPKSPGDEIADKMEKVQKAFVDKVVEPFRPKSPEEKVMIKIRKTREKISETLTESRTAAGSKRLELNKKLEALHRELRKHEEELAYRQRR